MSLTLFSHRRATTALLLGGISAAMGLFVLAGWAMGIPWIKSVLPGAVEMKANTALGLLLSGVALCLLESPGASRRVLVGQGLGAAVTILGAVTLSEYGLGWDWHIDELLFRDTAKAYNVIPGRMSPFSTVAFTALGLGIVTLPHRPLRWVRYMTGSLTLLIGGVSFIGYVWNASELVTDRYVPPVAVNTAAAFILLGAGLLVSGTRIQKRVSATEIPLSAIETRILAGFLGTLFLLLLAGSYTYKTACDAAEAARQVAHTQEVRATLDQLYAAISDAESGQWTHLLTGDPHFLETYQGRVAEVELQADASDRLVNDNPDQQRTLAELRPLIGLRMNALARVAEVFSESGLPTAQEQIMDGGGHKLMETIRSQLNLMDAREQSLLNLREASSARNQLKTLVSMLATLSTAVAGFLVLFSGIRREMAHRTRAEQRLRRSEESLGVTLRSIGDAVLATDTKGRITRMNPVAEALTGWTQAEASGRPVEEVFRIINEETRQPALIPVQAVLDTGDIHGLANHTIIIARDGTERPIADSAAPIRDKEGHILGVVLVFRDVTEEKQAELALRDSERQLRTLNEELEVRVAERTAEVTRALETLNAIDDATVIFDPETLRHTYVNAGATLQLGYTREELLAMTPVDFKPDYTEDRYRELLAPMQRGDVRTHRFTTQHRHKDGHDFPVEILLQYITPPGERPRFISIGRDISERRKAERQALRSQRLESVGTLAGGVAHDLNNALAPIMMGVELLRDQYPEETRILDMFETSAKRGAEMVRRLLSFAKGQEGEHVLLKPIHLLRELETLMKGSFPKNIELVFRYAANLPLVMADATQLHQVLLNLCVNARDAMPDGGTLTLEAEAVEVDSVYASSVPDAKAGPYFAIRVRDTGTGIPQEIIDRIFEPFFTTKGQDKGTGLGLSTVVGIIKGHGGFLQVYSQVGHGSKFSVYLPASKHRVNPEPAPKVAREPFGRGETILLVDDESGVRTISRIVLRRLNFTPLIAVDGADGLILAAQNRADVRGVITDLHMPRMDGLAFVRELRVILPDIPVIVASGRMDDAVAAEFKALGVTRRLDKPFNEAQLADALKALLNPG